MNLSEVLQVVTGLGWLMLAGSALASFRLGWSKALRLALIWLAIFMGLFLVATWLGLGSDKEITGPARPVRPPIIFT